MKAYLAITVALNVRQIALLAAHIKIAQLDSGVVSLGLTHAEMLL